MISNNILENAILFATEKHRGQKRKGDDTPYILHPFRVMNNLYMVKRRSKNLQLLMAVCVLHDVVEDCNVSLAEIAEKFGYHVAAIVEELTTDKAKCDAMGKEVYLLDKMTRMTRYALCIKLSDRLDNVRDMANMDDAFRQKTTVQTLYILNGLETSRELTRTHKILIKQIRKELKQYEK